MENYFRELLLANLSDCSKLQSSVKVIYSYINVFRNLLNPSKTDANYDFQKGLTKLKFRPLIVFKL